MRKSAVYLIFLFTTCLFLAGLVLAHRYSHQADCERRIDACRAVTRSLGLTDICLFTEARYTRHLSQADIHSAFQDYPMAFEHFPSGSIALPPEHLISRPGRR